MLLILNLIVDEQARKYFDEELAKRIIGDTDVEYKIDYLGKPDLDLSEFTHLLITGSELSASQENDIDERLYSVIEHFVQNGKRVLGICYGYQMLAKFLFGKGACRRAEKPEFGWKKMRIVANPLFEGISENIFLESRYDEVCCIDSNSKILASNESCKIQAFQFKDNPIWGMQFHPEFLYEDGSKMVENHLIDNPKDREFYANELVNSESLEQNLRIFKNFLREK
mgnify:CR=1 FL=1|jgi:GMP synthase (glutamine-hydrolysing)